MPQTLIEFFDESPLENVAAGLTLKPSKIIYLGPKNARMKAETQNYARLFALKGIDVQIECKYLSDRNKLDKIQSDIEAILNENPDCVIDITGGDERIIAAAGAMQVKRSALGVSLCYISINSGRITEVCKDGETLKFKEPELTVNENIFLYGGSADFDYDHRFYAPPWYISDKFRADVAAIWDVCRANCVEWNEIVSPFGAWIDRYSTEVRVNKYHCANGETPSPINPLLVMPQNRIRKFFNNLIDEKIITGFSHSNGEFGFSFTSAEFPRVFEKAGNVLELVTLIALSELKGKYNKPFFNDVQVEVNIDWDGVLHYSGPEASQETTNEVDIVAMRGLIPHFVSCKNGHVDVNELYKLSAVADKFGGGYGKKIMIATFVNKDPGFAAQFAQRAKDMGIVLIDNVHELSIEELSDRMKAAINNS